MIQTYQGYIYNLNQQVEGYKVELEKAKTRQLQYRAANDERSAKAMDATVRQQQNNVQLKQQELSMYQQGISSLNAPRSSNQSIAALQDQLVQLNFEKSRLGLSQTAATQAGNQAEVQRLTLQVTAKQNQIQAKMQEIKLMELQAKTGRF